MKKLYPMTLNNYPVTTLGVLTARLGTRALNDRAILLSAGLRQTHKGIKAGNDSALSLVTQPAKVTADRSSER